MTVSLKHTSFSAHLRRAGLVLSILFSTTQASINCQSPAGSYQVGESLSMRLGDNGWWPKAGDIYSATAKVLCSSGDSQFTSFGVSNGDSWDLPESALGACPGNEMYVEFSGSTWDVAHWTHIFSFSTKCSSFTVGPAPPKPTPPTATTAPPTITTLPPPIFSSVIVSGTVVPITPLPSATATGVAPLPPGQTPVVYDPSVTQLPGLPSSEDQQGASKKSDTNIPAAALGAVGGMAALALLVFGLVVTRKKRRLARERQDMAILKLRDDELDGDDYDYDPGMVAVGTGLSASSFHHNMQYQQLQPQHLPRQLDREISYPSQPEQSFQGDFAYWPDAGGAGAAAQPATERQSHIMSDNENYLHKLRDSNYGPVTTSAASPALLPFPVPSATSPALKERYALANLATEDPGDSADGSSSAAAAAVDRQRSLQQELNLNANTLQPYVPPPPSSSPMVLSPIQASTSPLLPPSSLASHQHDEDADAPLSSLAIRDLIRNVLDDD